MSLINPEDLHCISWKNKVQLNNYVSQSQWLHFDLLLMYVDAGKYCLVMNQTNFTHSFYIYISSWRNGLLFQEAATKLEPTQLYPE